MNLKRMLCATIFISYLFIWCQAASATDWRPAGDGEFDASRITRISPSVIRVWQKHVLCEEILDYVRKNDPDHDYSDYSHTIALQQIDCKKQKIGMVSIRAYNTRGGVINSIDNNDSDIVMDHVIPDSYGEDFVQEVCNYANKKPKKKKR